MVTKQKILIVDDDENIAELISLYLTKECFDTMIVHDGEEALTAFESYQPNLMLLDLMLPGIDGYQVCREIRSKHNTPIIMLSAKGEVFDKVLGLELGADDYVLKPFDSKELVARVKAVLRRYQPAKPETPAASRGKVVDYPGIEINLTNYAVTVDGKNVDMPPKELELLYFLASSISSAEHTGFTLIPSSAKICSCRVRKPLVLENMICGYPAVSFRLIRSLFSSGCPFGTTTAIYESRIG